MATVTERSHRHRVGQMEKTAAFAPKAKQRRHWRLALVLAVLVAIIWLLPSIVVHTPLLHWILGKATADINGSVTVGSASLGWFSPIAVEGVEVKDAKGKSVLTLPAAIGDRSLLAILCNYTNLGTFRLDSPRCRSCCATMAATWKTCWQNISPRTAIAIAGERRPRRWKSSTAAFRWPKSVPA